LGERGLDAGETARELLLGHVDERHAHARARRDLGDAGAHLGGADDEHVLLGHDLPTSITIASPCPPPEQIAARPRPPPRRRSSYISVPTSRAPEAPTGWPSATAPPLTVTSS